MTYYWLSNKRHSTNDIILPGNWGRLVKNTPEHRWIKMELQFETIRLQTNPKLPSRLECAFVCDDLKIIKLLQSKRPGDHIYEVIILDKNKPIYRADMALVHPELERYNAQVGNPKKYWNQNNGQEIIWPEILTLSPLKILRKLG